MGHPYAKLIAAYALDAKEIDKPWERWEYRYFKGGGWHPCLRSPSWEDDEYVYRSKPRTININGHEVQEPLREELKCGDMYHVPSIYGSGAYPYIWQGSDSDFTRLHRGLCHDTKDAAITHAMALISFTAKK